MGWLRREHHQKARQHSSRFREDECSRPVHDEITIGQRGLENWNERQHRRRGDGAAAKVRDDDGVTSRISRPKVRKGEKAVRCAYDVCPI